MPVFKRAFMKNACGMDFGTSNSTVGWINKSSNPILLDLENNNKTLPSVVFYNAEEGAFSYGRQALNGYLEGYEGRLMRSLKSLLGTSAMQGQTEVGGQVLKFSELLTHFIGELKKRAEFSAGTTFDHVVLGRPVHFVDDNPAADLLAQQTLESIAHSVGFKSIEFQFEPIAAAFDYENQITQEELVLIVDIGGGTSDFSIVRLSPERKKNIDRLGDVLANGGVHIGGTDFDKYLSLSSVMPYFGYGSKLLNQSEVPSSYYFNLATWHTINQLYTRQIWQQLQDVYRDVADKQKFARLLDLVEQRCGHWLAMQVESGKIALSTEDTTSLNLDRLSTPEIISIDIQTFDDSVTSLLSQIDQKVESLLQGAQLTHEQIDSVFFTGGSSGIRALRSRIRHLLPAAKHVEGNLFGSIGMGLALDAERKFQ